MGIVRNIFWAFVGLWASLLLVEVSYALWVSLRDNVSLRDLLRQTQYTINDHVGVEATQAKAAEWAVLYDTQDGRILKQSHADIDGGER